MTQLNSYSLTVHIPFRLLDMSHIPNYIVVVMNKTRHMNLNKFDLCNNNILFN